MQNTPNRKRDSGGMRILDVIKKSLASGIYVQKREKRENVQGERHADGISRKESSLRDWGEGGRKRRGQVGQRTMKTSVADRGTVMSLISKGQFR